MAAHKHSDPTALLKQRAQALAQPPPAETAEDTINVIEFALAHERYGLEAGCVTEVHSLENLTPLPCTPPFIRGLVNLRGRIVPVIDLKRFFDLPERGITDLHAILLVEADGLTFGLLADMVVGVRPVALSALEASLPTLSGIRADYLKGVAAGGLVVLNAAAILADRRIILHEEVES